MPSEKKVPTCDPYVWEDPRYLFRSTWFEGKRGTCFSELVNESIFVYLFALVVGGLAGAYMNASAAPIISVIAATVYLIPVFLKMQDVDAFRVQFIGADAISKEEEDPSPLLKQGQVKASVTEGFGGCTTPITRDKGGAMSGLPQSGGKEGFKAAPVNMNDVGVEGNLMTTKFQNGTSACVKNPFHNVLVDEYKYAPTREAAPDITTAERKTALDEFFRVQWYSDPTDVFGKAQSQREFVTAPSTTIPNDQASYQDWLYKIPGKTCKEGGVENCYGGTNGGVLPWVNM
jgi:hypothetical protein